MLMRILVVVIVVRCLPDKSSLERCLSRERACKVAIMMMRLLVMMFMMFVKTGDIWCLDTDPSGSTLRVKNCVQDLQPPAPTAILVSGPRSSLSKHQMIIILPNGPASNHQSENINDNHHQTIHSGRMDIIQIVKMWTGTNGMIIIIKLSPSW